MKAAILTAINQPLEVRDIQWVAPQYGQVLVRVLVSGICGAQLQEIRGEKGTHFPRLLGHEACVDVLQCGPGVKTVKAGDRAVAHWRKGDGIESEFPQWIEPFGSEPRTAGLITTFSKHSTISENRLTAVPKDTPPDLCALLGCGLSTALGTIENESNLKFGERILILGCGGLGVNLILASRLRQASRIEVIDPYEEKRIIAYAMGATAFFRGREQCLGDEFDVVVDTSGDTKAIAFGISKLSSQGRFIMVGQPKPGESVVLHNARHLFDGDGKSILATQGGGFSPSEDIRRYIDMFRSGPVPTEGIVTHRLPLAKINDALDLVRAGCAGRVMINCAE